MSTTKRQLVVIMTGPIVVFVMLKMDKGIPDGGTVLHRGATEGQYEAFTQHFYEKFKSKPTMDDAKDLWVVWAKDNNIPDSEPVEETKSQGVPHESLFVPEVDGHHTHSHSALGISKERKQVLVSAIEGIGFGSTVSHILSEVSRVAESHAELLMIGLLVGSRVAELKKNGGRSRGVHMMSGSLNDRDMSRVLELLRDVVRS